MNKTASNGRLKRELDGVLQLRTATEGYPLVPYLRSHHSEYSGFSHNAAEW